MFITLRRNYKSQKFHRRDTLGFSKYLLNTNNQKPRIAAEGKIKKLIIPTSFFVSLLLTRSNFFYKPNIKPLKNYFPFHNVRVIKNTPYIVVFNHYQIQSKHLFVFDIAKLQRFHTG